MSREVLRDSKSAAAAINVLGSLIGLLEGGVARGWQKTAHQIFGICKREQQRQLKIIKQTRSLAFRTWSANHKEQNMTNDDPPRIRVKIAVA